MATDEQTAIADTVRRLLDNCDAARRAYDGGAAMDGALWANLADLGMLGIAVPEDFGGIGLGLAEEAIVVEALARHVAPVPVVPAFVAAHILAGGNDVGRALSADLVAGTTIIGPCLSAQSGLPVLTLSSSGGATARVSGVVADVFEGAVIELFLVHSEGRWWAIDVAAPGVTRTEIASLDQTRRLARVEFAGVVATAVSDAAPDHIMAVAWTLLAAEALGTAQAALDMTCAYALQRQQFGQPIGRFQAIKQKLAECLLRTEGARSAVWGAVRSCVDGVPDAAAARLAKAEAGAAASFVVAEAVQTHGAIGCTWEHDLHLFMRRAKHTELSLGSPDTHLRVMAEAALVEATTRSERGPKTAQDVGFVPSPEDEAFIAPFRDWLATHATKERLGDLRRGGTSARRAWQAEMAEAGWMGVHWSSAHGGRDASFTQQVLYYAELTRHSLPPLPGNRGLMLVGPTLIAHGTPQQQQLLEPTRRAEILWAGGFSERGAGSDLASLRTRGVVDGDELVITGHKIWTSQAQTADWMYALIRTGPLTPKHAGISVVLIPMHAAGVEVRPIRRNNGDYHFNEVFFDEVRVPLSNIVGPVNAGWSVNRTTMVGEHLTNFLGSQAAQAGTMKRIARAMGEREAVAGIDHALRQRFAESWATTQVIKLHGLRNVARFTGGESVGAESSIPKVVGQENEKRMYELMIDVMGAEGLQDGIWGGAWLSTRASTIGGGTSEIHRNKLAERVLGMPRDLWADEAP
jgi:alkylation response protein AidB-like acyl-CoA dehydrogenase